MKYKKLLNISGMITTLVAFICMAIGIALTIHALFFTSIGVLLLGIVLSSILPSYITAKWQKMMIEHGVPAKARLVNMVGAGGRFGDIRLDFQTENDITTSAFVQPFEKDKFTLDKTYNIKYNPDEPELCLVVAENEIAKPAEETANTAEEVENEITKAE